MFHITSIQNIYFFKLVNLRICCILFMRLYVRPTQNYKIRVQFELLQLRVERKHVSLMWQLIVIWRHLGLLQLINFNNINLIVHIVEIIINTSEIATQMTALSSFIILSYITQILKIWSTNTNVARVDNKSSQFL